MRQEGIGSTRDIAYERQTEIVEEEKSGTYRQKGKSV
jgi:hypothetical protein